MDKIISFRVGVVIWEIYIEISHNKKCFILSVRLKSDDLRRGKHYLKDACINKRKKFFCFVISLSQPILFHIPLPMLKGHF